MALLGLAGLAATVCLAAPAQEDPWADVMVDYSPNDPVAGYDTPANALGAPMGISPMTPVNEGVVCLGRPHGSVTLKFDTPVTDDPLNPMGLDCIVYSNCLWVGGNPVRKWQEPAVIEISRDDNGNGLPDDAWYIIPGSRGVGYSPFPLREEPAGTDNQPPEDPDLMGGNITNPNTMDGDPGNDDVEYNWGYAEMTPTMAPYRDNYVRPDDPLAVGITFGSGGGDAFDIATAIPETEGLPALTEFDFIRITAFVDRHADQFGWITPEIDAVADVAPDIDTDGDGILDEYETRVAGTDPDRPESTVLPLEIPWPWEGSGRPGVLLGSAERSDGTRLRLFSAEERTSWPRSFNVNIDILVPAEPGGDLPSGDLLKSGTVREIVSSEADFEAAGIEHAQVRIPYTAGEISGLDETGLEPYRHQGGSYTQDGISQVDVNTAANFVTFRTRYPGVFLLAATAGSGDETSEGPQGTIVLSADPSGEVVADPVNTVVITSDVILDGLGDPVDDGTLITVATSRGSVTTADADGATPGVQVATAGAAIAFTVEASTTAGSVHFTASSVEGTAFGELDYTFAPGPPVGPVEFTVGPREGSGPVTADVTTSVVTDQYGNVVRDGTLLTVTLDIGTIVSGDADDALPGHQIVLTGGRGVFTVEVPSEDTPFTVSVYADAEQTELLGEDTLTAGPEEPALPWHGTALLLALMLAVFAWAVRQDRKA